MFDCYNVYPIGFGHNITGCKSMEEACQRLNQQTNYTLDYEQVGVSDDYVIFDCVSGRNVATARFVRYNFD